MIDVRALPEPMTTHDGATHTRDIETQLHASISLEVYI